MEDPPQQDIKIMTINPLLNNLMSMDLKNIGKVNFSGVVDENKFNQFRGWCRKHPVIIWEITPKPVEV